MTKKPRKAKTKSEVAGKEFLQQAFHEQQESLLANLRLSAASITHDGKRGDVDEQHFIGVLRSYLPDRYRVDSGIAIDSRGRTSDQLDVVIYDRQYTPTLLDQKSHKYVPAEAIYGVLEVKPVIDKRYLEYTGGKAASVRRLLRTSVAIAHAGGRYAPKPHVDILAGVIAPHVEWADGFGATFLKIHAKLTGDRRVDCGVVVDGHSFDVFNGDGTYTFDRGNNALVFWLFRLLQKLQSLGTVPAIDWNAYAAQLSR